MRKRAALALAGPLLAASALSSGGAPAPGAPLRIGLIGLDTSHVVQFTSLLNDASHPEHVPGARVVAAFKGGSPDVEASATRIERFTAEVTQKWGVELVDSIEALCAKVDAVILTSVDGRQHLAQVRPVFAARKPVFIDKPLAGSWEDAHEIARLARESGTPFFSSSSLRFQPELVAIRSSAELGDVLGASAHGPCPIQTYVPDLFWYGIHTVEMLYTLMGPGAETVTRVHTPDADVVVGRWRDGRIGVMRGQRTGPQSYGAMAYGRQKVLSFGAPRPDAPKEPAQNAYPALLKGVVEFFRTGVPPVTPEETVEIMAFMQAADLSKARQGAPVALREVTTAAANAPGPVWNRAPLQAGRLGLLPLGAVRPRGWLERQLRIQADGLTGHLDEFWADVGPDSGWLGGAGESWERGPYFLDGLLPLAHLLDDARLKAKARKWVEWTLTNQGEDGWIGPRKNTDWWPNMVMLKVLTQHQEATGDVRVVPLLQRYFAHHLAKGAERPLHEWASYRWADELLSVLWLYNRTGDGKLLELARLLHAQGADWKRHFAGFEFTQKTSREQLGMKPGAGLSDRAMRAHGVNNAMALKTSALWSLVSGDKSDREAIHRALEVLDRHHGQPNGMFSGDEHYAGTDPSQGIELCAVVEALFSLQQVLAVTGDPALADRLERIAFNAMPATFSPDMWAHQYDQQPNQVLCSLRPRSWVSNGSESNVFGLEPNFGCCTANMHQGWPKLVQSLWMATPDQGLAAVAYAPSEVRTSLGNGTSVRITEDTEYPFRGAVTLTIAPERPVEFPLLLRIPGWAPQTAVTVNGQPVGGVRAGEFLRVVRSWQPGDRVVLTLPMTPRVSTWHRDSVAVERGPLVFALRIGEDWRKLATGMKKPAPGPAADWEVHPTTPWNYGLIVNPKDAAAAIQARERTLADNPFSPDGAPVELTVKGRRVPAWTLVDGSAGPLPQSPVASREPDETLTLIPYGSAKLRVTAFPRIEPR